MHAPLCAVFSYFTLCDTKDVPVADTGIQYI